jgi:hypothetical protein
MRVSLTVLSLLALGAACIPSYRLVHDSNRYFEHCYGADFEPSVAAGQKEACWQAWIAHYTRHQPANRVDYAMRRIEALQSGEPLLALPGMPNAGGAAAPVAQPLPAGPTGMPPTATAAADHGDAGPDDIPNGCLEACNAYEGRCVSQCPAETANCRIGCTRERAICLGGCH